MTDSNFLSIWPFWPLGSTSILTSGEFDRDRIKIASGRLFAGERDLDRLRLNVTVKGNFPAILGAKPLSELTYLCHVICRDHGNAYADVDHVTTFVLVDLVFSSTFYPDHAIAILTDPF